MSLIEFTQSRIAMGRMIPVALSRVNALVRTLERGLHMELCAIDAPSRATGGHLHTRRVQLSDANAFVNTRHRHLAGVVGHKFSVGAFRGVHLVGVAIVGRPVARLCDNGRTLEILRVATDGTRNACSKLYGAARRQVGELGYPRVLTYTLPEEGGASLRAAGFECEGPAGGGSWDRMGRRRGDRHPTAPKTRWSSACPVPPRRKEPARGARDPVRRAP